jgi:peptidoglycan/xylan/chitin deacetylase (PgdA/CDA1 family)
VASYIVIRRNGTIIFLEDRSPARCEPREFRVTGVRGSCMSENRGEASPVWVLSGDGSLQEAVRSTVELLLRLVGRRVAWAARESELPSGVPLVVLGAGRARSSSCVVLPAPSPGCGRDADRPWVTLLRRRGGEPVAFRQSASAPRLPAEGAPWVPEEYRFEEGDAVPLFKAGPAVHLDCDMIGDALHLLSGAEEYDADERDAHDRFPLRASERRAGDLVLHPIVHYYAELLREMLKGAGFLDGWTPPEPVAVLSHDVDNVTSRHWRVALGRAARTAGYLRGRSPAAAGAEAWRMASSLVGPNRWWTFPRIREIERRHGAASTFYFLGGSRGRYGPRYRWDSPRIRETMKDLVADGCVVALHMGYYAHRDPAEMSRLKNDLEQQCGVTVQGNRSHYLRFRTPDTWNDLGEAGIAYDSSIGYAELEGFRAGAATVYRPFDLRSGSALPVVELPLVAMDSCLFENRGRRQVVDDVLALAGRLRGTNSAITLLWHVRAFAGGEFESWGTAYEEILESLASMGFGFATDEQVVRRFLAGESGRRSP